MPAYVQPPKAVDVATFRGEIPEVDVDETSTMEPPTPSVPPSDFFDQVPGYGVVGMQRTHANGAHTCVSRVGSPCVVVAATIQLPVIDKAASQTPKRHASIPP